MIISYNLRKSLTVIPRYRVTKRTMLILCYYENILCLNQSLQNCNVKKTTSKKEEIRLHSDSLWFFQSSFSE